MIRFLVSTVLLTVLLVSGCARQEKKDSGKPLIGLAMETLK
jgi:outer membrane murein-binding lipoprotein Lpp